MQQDHYEHESAAFTGGFIVLMASRLPGGDHGTETNRKS